MQKQFEDFKKKSEADISLLTTKLNEERAIYNKEIARLNDLIKMKEMEAKQKLLDIQMTLQKDIKNLEATQNLKKELLFEQTNKQIAQTLEDLNNKKSDANKKFDEELKKKQSELDKSLEDQKKDYANRINALQATNKDMVANLESLAQKYKLSQEEQNKRLKNLTEDKQKEYKKIQEEYNTKAKNEESKFKELIKKLEDQKLQTITNFTKETEKELSRLNTILEEQKAKNKIESDQKREELRTTIIKLEDEKIKLVQQKNAETKKALDNIQQMYDKQANEIKKKLDEYNKLKSENDKKMQNEMIIFNNNMKKLEEDKIKKVKDYTNLTKQELDKIGKNLEEERLKAKADGIKYKKELEDTIEKLDKERMQLIKKKNDETASILNKIKQEYEKEVESVNKSIKEYNDKKKQYDINIKKIDEEQTAYVAKKRTESEEQLGKLSKMLTDEIESLKNKIEEHKINRNLKVKEINELSEKLQEIQKQYDVDTQKKATINNVILISTSTIIVILSIYIYYLKKM
jgi:putative ABC transport system permease protein